MKSCTLPFALHGDDPHLPIERPLSFFPIPVEHPRELSGQRERERERRCNATTIRLIYHKTFVSPFFLYSSQFHSTGDHWPLGPSTIKTSLSCKTEKRREKNITGKKKNGGKNHCAVWFWRGKNFLIRCGECAPGSERFSHVVSRWIDAGGKRWEGLSYPTGRSQETEATE